jgi:hypothetical protein
VHKHIKGAKINHMEIKNNAAQKEIDEMSSNKKVQPVLKSFFKEKYDIILEEIEWETYMPGKFISKYV